jgi:hypothetical protein
VIADGLTSSAVTGAGGAVNFRGYHDADNRSITRAINSYTPPASLYFSGTLSATIIDTDAVSFIAFTQAASSTASFANRVLNGDTFDGVAFGFKGNGTGMDLVIRYRGTAGSYVDTILVDNVATETAYTVAGKINWNVSGANDSLRILVNGIDSGTTLTGELGAGDSINTVGLAQTSYGTTDYVDVVTMDELRLWAFPGEL